MCHFITAILPQEADVNRVAPIFGAHKLSFEKISNPHVLSQLEPGDVFILTTASHCDCGTALGMLTRGGEPGVVNYEREVKKFRGRGWSEAKIQRWLEQKEQTKEKHSREDEARAGTGTPDAAHWMKFISDVLESGHARRIGLLLHLYHGGVESERIKIQGRRRIRVAALAPRALMEISEDVVYEFVP